MSKTDAIKSLAEIGAGASATQSERDKLTDLSGSSKTDKPASDQGFGSSVTTLNGNPVASRPANGAASQGAASNETGGGGTTFGSSKGSSGSPSGVSTSGSSAAAFNPMDPFKGTSLGGPLGTGATENTKTLADFNNKGLISTGLFDAVVDAATAAAGAATKSVPGAAAISAAGSLIKAVKEKWDAEEKEINDKRQAEIDKARSQEAETLARLRAEEAASSSNSKSGVRMPNPENTGSKVNILTQPLLDQLNASKAGQPVNKGGSGDVTPVTEAGVSAVVRNGSIAVNAASVQGRNLFGQPGGAALGENASGGNRGLNGFSGSNGAGVINPGNEAGSPGGDPRFQQDPAAALGGGKPAGATPSLNTSATSTRSDANEQSSSVSATLASGLRTLTLTGTAAINGSGNSLDNLINGNGAANELRGEAGNDNLDGKAGNDLLDGGSGRDLLTGGAGADRFRFASAGGFGTAEADRITDFSRSEADRIELSRSAFGLAAGAALSFQAVSNDADLNRALGSSTLLIQDLRDGSILFNQNVSTAGVGQGGVFAVVNQGLTLQSGDFALIA